jgi:hypothetical protein
MNPRAAAGRFRVRREVRDFIARDESARRFGGTQSASRVRGVEVAGADWEGTLLEYRGATRTGGDKVGEGASGGPGPSGFDSPAGA